MYGFPLIWIGNAFCAPRLPSSQVSVLMMRMAGFALRDWKSLTSRSRSPFAAPLAIVMYAVLPSLANSRSCHTGLSVAPVGDCGGATKNPAWQPNEPCAHGISFGFVASEVSATSMLGVGLSGVM